MNTLTLADGHTLSYRDAGQGPPLVLLHGWSLSATVFSEMIEGLAADFRVLAPDLRGHGSSDCAPGFGLEDFSADLRQWLDALNLDTFYLGGWSLGGQVALKLAQVEPQRIERLLLVATTPRFSNAEDWIHGLPDVQVRSLARNLRRVYEKTLGDFFALQFGPEEITPQRYRQILAFAVRPGRVPAPEAALAALETLRQVDLRADLHTLGCPTLVVHGRNDAITPVAAGRYLASAIPDARLHELADVGHAPFFSRPEQILSLWREFLS
ncbi:pimeloyl-[acyl-carrier protein] methyl ester esterase [Geoalkalibacter ferrihydriticus]|uniref:AB hydrolase-1 domain-containing protein n=2 Tax=Geoalkalibacter ferrihydriticus TaxID=392333 RepID=A0A0C2DU90_9BACT|nr:alpha/beta fold hydrolase [Geoalkalibacter ferrihydriticus]KIH77019.1 hypothetical protein GFER_08155 [Geoalkalibacter ferrihydriticus DSM 17813]SDL38757.1 pimeloyl-[acyl-carrier protein] methyl ester esterase [Geoalkalibacter ferrihydriticus]